MAGAAAKSSIETASVQPASDTAVEEADIAVAEDLGRHRHNPLVRALGSASEIADQAPLFSVCGAVFAGGIVARRPRVALAGVHMLASALVATGLKSLVKNLVTRTRPHLLLDDGTYEAGISGPDDGNWQSFPSGHTAGAVAVARAMAHTLPGSATPGYLAAAAIGAIQVPRGKHFPIDVAAGAILGLAAEAIVDRGAGLALSWFEDRGSEPAEGHAEDAPAPG